LLTIKRRGAEKTKFKYQVEPAPKTTADDGDNGKQRKKLSSLKFLMTFPLFAQGNESQQRHYVAVYINI